jgi:2-polyprenyl-6-methoxyphenol hydroxylase-like FAD-dependent oxidoreductase
MLLIPREKKLVRLYVRLEDLPANTEMKSIELSSITPETILRTAQKILSPYKLNYVHCNWWTIYRIGQRVSNHFAKSNRIFLAGDAVHTHSPKAVQGQNVSMQDTYNLGWKIGMVLKGETKPSVLETYTLERQSVARELIKLDQELSKLYTQNTSNNEVDETSTEGIARIFRKERFVFHKSMRRSSTTN